ncbi:hypothetical protein AN5750.2 [Aspergillus nidulans FGSC A4]|uniref:Only prolin and serin are matching in the corresponding protein n=1 Tax=Emericella nidulans (strain FGSC A4 / ATCC 38163 / CBS 112.46 / NRRL 194 / M139) TaxID=227321 RepID=Q5B130_EMENI|nr:hypothetical protein [Aspergillus nidulans FGSC A4]EAA62843.1 hypothetical protein AN5750.2 [Aspergillus nidulans FGSC A4]CBF81281.1 TPA: conserved hypothetical protein [Aspergillus nidulans FGSC A4]|eukprot:XP_663354.1 hypothetical protein AN5750.2 [Aspergillus nidulans FGSC A4]
MLKLSQLLEAKRRESNDNMGDPSPLSRQPPQSPLTASTPVSPAVSLFSAKGHTRFSSSASSLVSSPGHGNSMDISCRNPLTGVKEEEPYGSQARDLEEEYFQHFDQGLSGAEDSYLSTVSTCDGYSFTDTGMDMVHSPKKRRSDNASANGLSRIGSRISTISNRWKSKRGSDGADGESFSPQVRSRTNSSASVFAASPTTTAPMSWVESAQIPPSPARTIFEEHLGESGAQPIDISKANQQDQDECAPQATTPLLPPLMGDDLENSVSVIQSPLQSPSVADVSNASPDPNALRDRLANLPSPPLSTKPSIASFSRPRASTIRTVSGDVPPLTLSDPNDEWAIQLGHANFTIQPEPYVPEVYDLESFRRLRSQWDLAQCNFTKHLVRTGEHYGVTSKIYKLTQEKWESINSEWKRHYEAMLAHLEALNGPVLSTIESHRDPCEQVKIPTLHDDKFPELGDGEIVGPMKIAPATGRCRDRSLKRNFFRFFHDLVSRV